MNMETFIGFIITMPSWNQNVNEMCLEVNKIMVYTNWSEKPEN